MRWPKFAALLLLSFAAFCSQQEEEEKTAQKIVPIKDSARLVLMITVDQLRGDYLDRFEDVYVQGGLRRFIEEAVLFVDAHQDHANTSTGPGHATIASGAYPAHSGIVNNQWYEENGSKAVYCVDDDDYSTLGSGNGASPGKSPRNLLVTTLPEWIRAADPESKALSISRKDRASILMGGSQANAAYWYNEGTGDFVSSSYYMQELPAWVDRFNQKKIPRSYFGKAWVPLPLNAQDDETLEVVEADHGWFDHGFPHAMGSFSPRPDPSFYTRFGRTPLMDEYMSQFVKEVIVNEELGEDEHVDYLALSFSVLDSVGHEYGPHSAEVLDTICRLDRVLADLLSYIDERIGLDKTKIVLSSDHGVMDLPEFALKKGKRAHRIDDSDILCLQQKGAEFFDTFGEDEDWFINGYHLDEGAIARKNLSKQEVEKAAAELFSQCDYVRKVWTRTDMDNVSSEEDDPFLILFRKSFHPDRSPDLLFQAEEFHVGSPDTGTSHGSPYRYDTHVPIAFLLPGVEAARVEDRVATVDIAPTVAGLLGLEVPQTVDGEDLGRHFTNNQ